MKSLSFKFVIAVLLSTAAAQIFASGNIRINIIDEQSRRAVESVSIILIPRNGTETSHSGDSTGSTLINDLEAGLYEIKISHPGYLPLRLPSVRVIDAKTTPVKAEITEVRGAMEEMLVVGSKDRQDFLTSVSSGEKDREALRSAAGGGADVLRSLDGLPGLFSDGATSNYTVRGNSPRNNLILVDGIPFANVVHFNDAFGEQEELEGGGRYSVFAPNIISSAKFQPGGWEPAYGGLSGSLLQLEVAEGNQDTPSFTLRFDVAGLEVGYDGPSYIHDDTSVLFSARSLDFTRLFETIGLDDLGEPSLSDIILKTTTELDDDKINLLILNSSESYSRDIQHVIASDEDELGDFEDVRLADSSRDTALYALSWDHLLANNGELIQRIYYRSDKEDASSGEAYPDLVAAGTPPSEVPVREDLLVSQRTEAETGYRLDFFTPNALGRFSTGLRIAQIDLDLSLDLREDWIRYEYSYRDQGPSVDQRYLVWTEENTDNSYTQSETNYTLYLDQNLPVGNWEFRAGLRYDRDNFSQQDIYSPRAAATWLATSNLRITSTVGRYNQTPSYTQRASASNNATLENELVDQLSLGFAYTLAENLEFFVEPYYQDMSNLITQPDDSLRERTNTGEGRAYGVDTSLSRSFEDGWSASINYSYNDSKIKDTPDGDYYDADFGRPHSVSIGGIWEINQRWKISTRWKYASGRPSDTYVVHEDVLGPGEPLRYSRETVDFNTGRYDAYNSLNMRVDYRRAFGRTNVIAFVDIINMLGSTNPGNTGFNERSGLDVEEDGSAVPLIGVRLEW
ncbi:Outer membrane receptor proteins, mostly Fe transport [Alteromonadaceae bacterium Bs31]|nr:Outer membrane receptor proteins, mostly Fe transport [Alteromonadaceae bacterium Bs31]